ncbi:MAG: hypothetical protein ACFBZ8_08400 [Opitutales bacterium]
MSHPSALFRRFSIILALLFAVGSLSAQPRSGGSSLRADNPEEANPTSATIPGQNAALSTRRPDFVVGWSAWAPNDQASMQNMKVTVNGEDWGHPSRAFERLKQMPFKEGVLIRMEMPLWPSVNRTFLPPQNWAHGFLKRCLLEDLQVEWYCYGYPLPVNVMVWLDCFDKGRYRQNMLECEIYLNGFAVGRVPVALSNVGNMPWESESGLLMFAPDSSQTPPQFLQIAQSYGEMFSFLQNERSVSPVVIELTLQEHLLLQKRLLENAN